MFKVIPWQKKKEQPLARLRDEFEALFDQLLSRWPSPVDTEYGLDSFWGLGIEDHENEIVVRAEVPGFESNELDVQLGGGLLTIKAEKKQETKKTGNGNVEEETYRSFHRSVRLPEGINKDAIEARYHNGVLEVHLPKSEDAKPKRIAVQT